MQPNPIFETDKDPVERVESALASIEALDGELAAWVEVDRGGALNSARTLASAEHTKSSPLYGVPVGIKDIYDVVGLPTRLGAGAFAHYRPAQDATAVSRLREAGAIIIGKTATTEFAHRDPAATRNPWNPDHTPGGSSSGSGAAVGAGMVPLALGSQTIGSTLRPAAFCGIVGLKPTHGRISAHGIFPLAPSFDHVGILCRAVIEAATVLSILAGYDPLDPFSLDEPVDDYVAAATTGLTPPRLALARLDYEATASEAVTGHLNSIAKLLSKAGAVVEEVVLPASSQAVYETGYPIFCSEAATVHTDLFARHGDDYRLNSRTLIEAGRQVSAVEYARARFSLIRLRREFNALLGAFDALLLPTAPSTALWGLEQTGSAVFCAAASFMGLPAISLPSGLSDDGLPLAVQLVSRSLDEAKLLGVASWVEQVLNFRAQPGTVWR